MPPRTAPPFRTNPSAVARYFFHDGALPLLSLGHAGTPPATRMPVNAVGGITDKDFARAQWVEDVVPCKSKADRADTSR